MGGSSKKQTVGYKYHSGVHFILCKGPIDYISKIKVGEKELVYGQLNEGLHEVNKKDLFGGESREGGVVGFFDILFGKPDQVQNSYLLSKLGEFLPAFRGVVSVILRQMYLGTNYYLKKWAFRGSRIYVRQDTGIEQWYSEKAGIDRPGQPGFTMPNVWFWQSVVAPASFDYWATEILDISDLTDLGIHSWTTPGLPAYYGPNFNAYLLGAYWAWPPPVTDFGSSTSNLCYARKQIYVPSNMWFSLRLQFDSQIDVWIDGVQVFHYLAPDGVYIPGTNLPEDFQKDETIFLTKGHHVILVKFEDHNAEKYGNIISNWDLLPGVFNEQDINPIHVIRECLTDPDWGMGASDSEIDEDAFVAAADTIYDEAMGYSHLWEDESSIDEYIKYVRKHIDAEVYVSNKTGKYKVKLIRDDYDAETLLELNPDNVTDVTDYVCKKFGDLTNQVTVTYWNADIGENSTIALQEIALIAEQGGVNPVSIAYEGFSNSRNASIAGQRDLKTLSTPLVSCIVYANTDAEDLEPGDCFKLTWPDYDIENMVMRVTGISYGSIKSNRVKIQCTQDIYAFPRQVLIAPTPPTVESPLVAQVISDRIVYEVPYLEAVQLFGQTVVDSNLEQNPEIGYVGAAAVRPQDNAINAEMHIDYGTGYNNIGNVDFCPTATLTAAINQTTASFAISNVEDILQAGVGSWFQINNELMKYVSYAAGTLTVERGLLDTLPQNHAAGSRLYFWDNWGTDDNHQFVEGEQIDVKLLTNTGSDVLSLLYAFTDTVEIVGRAARPYPPGNFKINSAYFPESIDGQVDVIFTLAHRDRTQQTGAEYIAFTEASIGPEVGVTYTYRIYSEEDILIHTESGSTADAYTYTNAQELVDLGGIGDISWLLVSALFHFDSGLTDETGKSWTVGGSAAISTAQAKFGPSSLFVGTSGSNYLRCAAHADFMFGTSDFTIEGWFMPTVSGDRFFYVHGLNTSGGMALAISTSKIIFRRNGTTDVTYTAAISSSVLTHIAFVRYGNQSIIFVNGALAAQATLSFNVSDNVITDVGASASLASDVFRFYGYIDEFRVSRVARYTAAFTPPTSEFFSNAPSSHLNGKLRVELESVRDGIVSYQKYNHTFERNGYGFNYGKRYGS